MSLWNRFPQQPGTERRLMSDSLKSYMVTLAADIDALGAFISDPAKAMKDAGLADEDAALLTSGEQAKLYVALTGAKLPVVSQPPAPEGAPATQPASAAPGSAAQQPGPTYPVVVGWSGPAPQPAGYTPSAYPAPFSPFPAYAAQFYASQTYPGQFYPSQSYPSQFYPSQTYPAQAGSPALPIWLLDWVARWWASVSSPGPCSASPTWPAAYMPPR